MQTVNTQDTTPARIHYLLVLYFGNQLLKKLELKFNVISKCAIELTEEEILILKLKTFLVNKKMNFVFTNIEIMI